MRELQQDLYKLCKLPFTLEQAGVEEKDLEKIARQTLDDGALTFNPEEVEFKDALEILKRAFREKNSL